VGVGAGFVDPPPPLPLSPPPQALKLNAAATTSITRRHTRPSKITRNPLQIGWSSASLQINHILLMKYDSADKRL